jgi:hypothetical protein
MISLKNNILCVAECDNIECSYRVDKEVQSQARELADWLTLGKVSAPQIWEFHDYSESCPGFVKVYPDELIMEASND